MSIPKRVIIVHGWDYYPEDGWYPWLKKELEARGFKVIVPRLPEPEAPRIQNWVPVLAKAVGEINEQTYFVGHSLGCQTIARYLESLPEGKMAGGVVFVAGFFKRLTNSGDDEEAQEIARHWLETPINLGRVRMHFKNSIALFSDNDQSVSSDNQEDFKNLLGSKIVLEHQKGHFDDCFDLPVALKAVLELSGEKIV